MYVKVKRAIRCIIFCVAIAVVTPSSAINGVLYDSGRLASSLIKQAHQDKYGFVWTTTEFGLSKFDGYHFTNYYHSSIDTMSILDNNVTSIASTTRGELYIGCNKGLMKYDYSMDHFIRLRFPDGIQPRVTSLFECPDGVLLISTAGYGIYSLDKSHTLRSIDAFGSMTNSPFLSLVKVERKGHVWAITNDGRLFRFTMNGGKPTAAKQVGKNITLIKMEELADGRMLLFTQSDILQYDEKTMTMKATDYLLPNDIKIASAKCIKGGDILIGTITNGLYIIKRGEKAAVEEQIFNYHFQLPDMTVNCIMQDKDQNIWLTSPRHGLYLSSTSKNMFHSWNLNCDGHKLCDGVASIAVSPDGGIFSIVNNKGLYHTDTNRHTTRCLGAPQNSSCIFLDSHGTYWLGTWDGLFTFDPATGKCTTVKSLPEHGILYMAEDKSGRIYYNVIGDGFEILDVATRRTTRYNSKSRLNGNGVRLSNDWTGEMYCDSKGLIWIATSSGMNCYDPDEDCFVKIDKDKGLLHDKCITSMCETDAHDLVIGTTDGVYLYQRGQNEVIILPGSDELRDMRMLKLIKDKSGDIWMSSMKGIWQYKTDENKLISHYGSNGIVEEEFHRGVCYIDDEDCIVFGANSCVTYFTPKEVYNSEKHLGEVVLTRFASMSNTYDIFADTFVIPCDDNSFSLEFSLLDYKNAANVTFEYRMNGSEWTAFNNDPNSLTFTKLKPGTYDIEVRASSGGIYSASTKHLTVEVEAPWYATGLAKTGYALVILIIVYLTVVYFYKRQKAAFDEEKMQVLINATHDIRSPLTLILGPVNKLKDVVRRANCDDEVRHTIDQYVDTIDRNAERLLLLVNQILDVRKIDKNQMKLKCRETDIVGFTKRATRAFEFAAEQRGIALSVSSTDEKVPVWIDRTNFDKVIANLLSNAFKYTLDGGEVKIAISHDDSHLTLSVSDSGTGFGNENTQKLFQRFYQGNDAQQHGMAGTGIGLNLAFNIVKLHGGTISAANRTDGQQGAVITINLPLGCAHLKPENIYVEHEEEKTSKKIIYQKHRIMVVDDDSELSAYVADELCPWFRIDEFTNGIDAMQALLSQEYDLVVSDVVMPDMDGIELLKKIKHNPNTNHIPVILLSSKSEVSDRMSGFKSGADAYLAKPFSIDELHARIDGIVDNIHRLRGKFTGAQQQLDNVEKIEVKGNDEELMKRVMKSVNSHIDDSDFNVDTLAQDVGLSRVQLHRKMKELTGVSIGKFVRNIRMEQAARLIKERKINVTQVAYSVGFSDQSYFSTVFKQYYGMSPSDYAKKEG